MKNKIVHAVKDWFFLVGVWFIGRADRSLMAQLMENASEGIKRQEVRDRINSAIK